MEPLSVVGLASAIITFLDFSWTLISGTWDIYHSLDGIPHENARLEDVTDDLESLTRALKSDAPIQTRAEQNIKRLAQDCIEDAATLKELLLQTKAPGRTRSVWRSLNAKWKAILKKEEVEQMRSQLQESRAEIQLNLTLMLREDSSAISLHLRKLKEDCIDLKTDQRSQLTKVREDLLHSLETETGSMQQQLTSLRQIIGQQLQELRALVLKIPIQHCILRHLISSDSDTRREQIFTADPDTCRWLLEGVKNDRPYREGVREQFISWLRTGSDILHICGNPGSGKSTLLKFISSHPKTRKELETWAGDRKLIIGQFYFWAAGTREQQTLPGLYNSLLFQILSQHPELIEYAFPRQLRQIKTSPYQADPSVEKIQGFGIKQIEEAFGLLLDKIQDSDYRACLIIDGLDEFAGTNMDHEELAATFKTWTVGGSGSIKLLVSSRPWRPFLKMFTSHTPLNLHKLNSFDIRSYVHHELEQDREIRQIGLHKMKDTIEIVTGDIVERSQGIFLWAHLILNTIREDIRRQYPLSLLKKKLQEYPSELDDLYAALRGPIERSPTDRRLSNRMLLLASAVPENFEFILHAIAFTWLPDDETETGLLDPSFPPSTYCKPYTAQEVAERLQRVTERVNGLTRGFLELETSPIESRELASSKVRFCHRTARDYLFNNKERYAAMQECWPNFHQSDPYSRIYLADLIFTGRSQAEVKEYLNRPFCRNFTFDTIRKFETPIRSALTPHWNGRKGSRCQGHSHDQDVSFLSYAAYCRLDDFVLSEVAKDDAVSAGSCSASNTSVLIASINHANGGRKGRYELTINLIRKGIGMDDLLEVCSCEDSGSEVAKILPAWVIALTEVVNDILYDISNSKPRDPKVWAEHLWTCRDGPKFHEAITVCSLLGLYSERIHQTASVTVKSRKEFVPWRSWLCRTRQFKAYVNGEKTFNTAQLLSWAARGGVNCTGHASGPELLHCGEDWNEVENPVSQYSNPGPLDHEHFYFLVQRTFLLGGDSHVLSHQQTAWRLSDAYYDAVSWEWNQQKLMINDFYFRII